jgi:hypothetical protein
LALTLDAEKELLKLRRRINELLPEKARKNLGVNTTVDTQHLIPTGERSGLWTRIAATESVSSCMPMKS